MDYYNIEDIKRGNARAGLHFFEPGTMRFFNSRIGRTAYNGPGGVYFVTSEAIEPGAPRRYKVRRFDPKTKGIHTMEPFHNFAERRTAIAYAKALAEKGAA